MVAIVNHLWAAMKQWPTKNERTLVLYGSWTITAFVWANVLTLALPVVVYLMREKQN